MLRRSGLVEVRRGVAGHLIVAAICTCLLQGRPDGSVEEGFREDGTCDLECREGVLLLIVFLPLIIFQIVDLGILEVREIGRKSIIILDQLVLDDGPPLGRLQIRALVPRLTLNCCTLIEAAEEVKRVVGEDGGAQIGAGRAWVLGNLLLGLASLPLFLDLRGLLALEEGHEVIFR